MLGQVITNFPQYSVGTYGYTIQVDLTYLYASSIDIIQLDNNGVSSLPITQKTALVSLQGYINDIACPNIAYSVDSDILTLFVKTSAYPYTDTTKFVIYGKRLAITIGSLNDNVDISDKDMELFLNYCIKGAGDILGIRTSPVITDNIRRLDG